MGVQIVNAGTEGTLHPLKPGLNRGPRQGTASWGSTVGDERREGGSRSHEGGGGPYLQVTLGRVNQRMRMSGILGPSILECVGRAFIPCGAFACSRARVASLLAASLPFASFTAARR